MAIDRDQIAVSQLHVEYGKASYGLYQIEDYGSL